MFLNRLYKYKRPNSDTGNQESGQLLIRFEKGEWIIKITVGDNQIIAFEWLETGEYLDEKTMQSYLVKFLEDLEYNSDNIYVVISGKQFQFLPAGYTSKNEEFTTIICDHDNSVDRLIAESLGTDNKMELVYSVPESLIRLLNTIFGNYILTHQAALFYKERRESLQDAFFICLYKNYMLIKAYVNFEVLFLKRIDWKTQDDLLFEIMSLYKHFSMDPLEIPLFAGGLITDNSPIIHHLRRYIKVVEMMEFKSFELLSPLPDLHESHLIEKV